MRRRRNRIGIERQQYACDSGEQSAEDVSTRRYEICVDPGISCSDLVSADREKIPPVYRSVDHHPHRQTDYYENDEWRWNAEQTSGRHTLQSLKALRGAEAFRFIIRDEACKSAVKKKSAKRNDECLNLDLRDQKTVDQSEPGRDRNHRDHGDRRRKMPVDEKDRKQNAKQRKNRSDRQIDAAGDDDESETDAKNSVDADQPCEIL